MGKLFDDDGGADARGGKAQFLGPARTIKVGGRIITERIVEPPPSDEDSFLNDLGRGISSYDTGGGLSGFGRFVQAQGGTNDFRGVPTIRGGNPQFGEDYGSEAFPEDDLSESPISHIDFIREDPYDQHDAQERQVWENDDLGEDRRDMTSTPAFEQSYTDQDTDMYDWEFQRYGNTHAQRRDALAGIFDDDDE